LIENTKNSIEYREYSIEKKIQEIKTSCKIIKSSPPSPQASPSKGRGLGFLLFYSMKKKFHNIENIFAKKKEY